RKQDDVLDMWRRDLEAARYAAQRAQRQYDAADPQNRLGAEELKRRWNQALQRVQQIELRIEQHVHGQGKTTTPTREEFEDLAAKLEAVWNCPDGPWIFNRRAIETEAAAQFRARVRGSNRNPAIPTSKQSTLGFSTT